MESTKTRLALRGSAGVRIVQGPNPWGQDDATFEKDATKNCKVMCFSVDGGAFAWTGASSGGVSIWRPSPSPPRRALTPIDHPRAAQIAFSPAGNVLATWEQYGVRGGEPAPNLHLWSAQEGGLLKSFFQKKVGSWCPQWSADEALCTRIVNNEVQFYANNDFESIATKLPLPKVESYSLSSTRYVVCFVPGKQGRPSSAKMYEYPALSPDQCLATKSFFQAERMSASWSCDGKRALLLTSSEVDKTGASYYGKQQLQYMGFDGSTAMVQLGKEGPIYEIAWNPKNPTEFAAVFGYMPSRAAVFNHECEKVFDFGTGPRNTVIYNGQGSLLLLAGFGNLNGACEVWDVKAKKNVSKFSATHATDTRWAPDGQHIMSSTCAPRLRQGNGYQIWHYTGSLLHEAALSDPSEELWEVCWQSDPVANDKDFRIFYKAIEGIQPSQPQASKEAYRPPCAKGLSASFTVHEEDEPAQNIRRLHDQINMLDSRNAAGGGGGGGGGEGLSKSAAKNKKRREAAAAAKKKEEDSAAGPNSVGSSASPVGAAPPPPPPTPLPASAAGGATSLQSTGDPERDKKLRKLDDKLQQIEKLKQREREGKKLEANQVEKMKKEADIVAEMDKLRL